MSYTIEKEKICVTVQVPKEDKRFPTYRGTEVTLFCSKVASNNVHPRTFEWVCLAADIVSEWDGRPQFKPAVWEAARAVDGGCIKPGGRNTSGRAYLGQWEKRYAERRPWTPNFSPFSRLSIQVKELKETPILGSAMTAMENLSPEVVAAIWRLFRSEEFLKRTRDNIYFNTQDGERLRDVLFLMFARDDKHIPIDIWLA